MDTVKIDTSKLELLNCDCNTESDIYIKDNDLIKVLKKSFIGKFRINTIKRLCDISIDGCVTPKYTVSTYKNNHIVGYGMDYLKDYSTLASTIVHSLPFEERKEISYKICNIINRLKDNNFVYFDCHTDNILYNLDSKDVEFIDIDSGYFKDTLFIDDYIDMQMNIDKYIAEICLKTLIGFDDYLNSSETMKLKIISSMGNKRQKYFINQIMGLESDSFNPIEYIDDFDEDFIMEARKIKKIDHNHVK